MIFKKNRQGFSLIEILIAVGILAGSVGVFLAKAQSATQMAVADEQELVAVMLANNKMIEAERDIQEDLDRGKFVDEMDDTGEFEEPYQDFGWAYQVRKVEIPVVESGQEGQSAVASAVIKNIMEQISKSVREVKVTVFWGDEIVGEDSKKQREHSFDLTTHVVNIN